MPAKYALPGVHKRVGQESGGQKWKLSGTLGMGFAYIE
jgi:hypothetical protein